MSRLKFLTYSYIIAVIIWLVVDSLGQFPRLSTVTEEPTQQMNYAYFFNPR